MGKLLRVEVAYALPEKQVVIALEVNAGATVRHAITASGVLRRFPEIDLACAAVGVFGKVVSPDAYLKDGDRVEIYRSLIADPKELRRQRVRRRTGPSRR
jgi:putative ubiquitin-RnfH superfamily antitoxin RatB of RatAB toxin-antitoxin module